MPHITLTEQQTQILALAACPVEVRDPQGKWLGRLDPEEAAIVAEVLSRRGQPQTRIPAHKVQEHLRALQTEWDRLGGFDREYMLAFLEKLRSKDSE
jgi:hypothetical protein